MDTRRWMWDALDGKRKNPILEAIDDPEVVERLVSRRDAVTKVGRIGATGLVVASVPAALGALAKGAFAQGAPQNVTEVLNFALTLEFLEDEFYRMALDQAPIPDSDRPYFEQVSKHETAHVQLLQQALGDDARSEPTFDFTGGNGSGDGPFDPFNDYPTLQVLAQGFEDTGVRAYKGQAGNLMGAPDTLTTALRIHSVEARHASALRRLRGLDDLPGWVELDGDDAAEAPADTIQAVYEGEANTTQLGVDTNMFGSREEATESFDEPLTAEQVLAIADPFIAD